METQRHSSKAKSFLAVVTFWSGYLLYYYTIPNELRLSAISHYHKIISGLAYSRLFAFKI